MSDVMGSKILARSLKSVGVDTVFWLLGGPMLEVEKECFQLGIKLVDVRHEQAAAMMAHAYGRVSGKIGVCITGSGCDTSNTVTGVAVAFADCAPLVAIGGSVSRLTVGMGSFQEMDQVALMKPITKQSWQIPQADKIPEYISKAFRHARSDRPGPIYLDLPSDVLAATVNEDLLKLPSRSESPGRPQADERLIDEAMAILEKAERPLVISGSGAIWSEAGTELLEFVTKSQIPFYTTPLARGLIAEDDPLYFPGARSTAWQEADVVLLVGTRNNFIVQYMRPPRFSKDLKLIMVNIDGTELGHNRPVDVGLEGDAKAVIRQLITRAGSVAGTNPVARQAWIERLKTIDIDRENRLTDQLESDEKPIHPLRLCKEIRDFLPRDAILVVDGHEILNFARQTIPTYYPRHRLNPGTSGCIGTGVPFGIGAKVASPEKPVMVLCGDGGFGMNGMEMDTAIRHNINVVVVVSNNGGWTGLPSFLPVGRSLGFTRYDRIVDALGGWSQYVEEPGEIQPALESAFASNRPALINVITSPVKAKTQKFGSHVALEEL